MLAEFVLTYICGFISAFALLFIAAYFVSRKKNK